MRYTTRKQDAEFLRTRLADATRTWAVGDECRSYSGYNGGTTTTVVKIEGSIVTLANGDSMHVSKMRRAR